MYFYLSIGLFIVLYLFYTFTYLFIFYLLIYLQINFIYLFILFIYLQINLHLFLFHLWTEGFIIPVHKQGNSSDPNNYCGITLNSCLVKLFCHVLNERISKYLEEKSFIGREQAGFRKNHRTSDQIFILKTIIDKYIHKSGKGNK